MSEVKMNIPFSPPDMSELEVNEVAEALRSGWITTGPRTKLFEQKIAEFCHTEKAVCLSSQTACAEMTLRILGVGPGDEVIVPTLDGKVKLNIHEGTQPGDEFKLRGKGIQRLNYSGRGDQYVKVVVEVPKELTKAQKDKLKEFEALTGEKNYKARKSFTDKIKRFFNE